jgi:hypothetical protein
MGTQSLKGACITKTRTYCVALEGFDGFVNTQLADMDTLVSTAGGKACVGLPVNIQCRS